MISAGGVESAESSQKKGLSGGGSESHTLNNLGSMGGSSSNGLGGVAEVGVGALENSVGSMVRLVVDTKNIFSSEGLSRLGSGSVDSEADSLLRGEALG